MRHVTQGDVECVQHEAMHIVVRHGDRNVLYTDASDGTSARNHAWCTSLDLVAVRGGLGETPVKLGETPVKFTWDIGNVRMIFGSFINGE